MFNTIHITSVYVLDQDEALAFYTEKLGFAVGDDVDLGMMRWLTVHPPADPDHQLLLELPGGRGHTEEDAARLRELVTKGALGTVILTTDDCQATYEKLVGLDVDITQEPVQQPYGLDCAIRDPFGNHIRVTQPTSGPIEITAADRKRWETEAG